VCVRLLKADNSSEMVSVYMTEEDAKKQVGACCVCVCACIKVCVRDF